MADKLRRALPAILGLILFAVALVVLRKELHAVTWHELTSDVLATPPTQLLAALLLTALNYAALTGYDLLAFAYIGNPLSRWRVAGASFLAYAVANSVGFAMFSGAAVRYRFYTRWGVTAQELSRIVFSYSVTFWLGLLALGGLSLVASPLPGAHELPAHELVAPVGWLLLLTSVAYLVAVVVRREPIRVWKFELPLPSPRIGFAQLGVSALDWALAAAVLYVLLPQSELSFLGLLGAFLAAQLLGLASHVPGGVGVFEGLMVLLLKPFLSSAQLLPALVVYRLVYYLLPLAMALVALVADELRQRREQAARAGAFLGWLSEEITPRVLAVFTFLAGAGLLFSGATPAAPGRLAWLDKLLPLGVIEASHFLGSIVGAGLLLVSQGLSRRLDAAYYLAAGGIAVGIAASLFKGADFEEATLLALLLVVLWRARPAFDRRAALFETRLLAGLDRGGRGDAGRIGLAGPLRLQARRVLPRAVVAVRAGAGGLALPAVIGRGGRGAGPVRLRPADAARPPRGPRAHGRRSRGRRRRDRRADRHVPVPGLPAGQGAALRRGPQGLRDVRRPGAHLGCARGSRGTARPAGGARSPVPRALRRLRRRPGVLRGRQGGPAPLRRLRPDLREAR